MKYRIVYNKAYEYIWGHIHIFKGYRYWVQFKEDGWFEFWKTDLGFETEEEALERISLLVVQHKKEFKEADIKRTYQSKYFSTADFIINQPKQEARQNETKI